MDLEEFRKRLRQESTAEVSYKTGISITTIDGLKSGRKQYPNTKTYLAIMAFLESKDVIPSSSEKSST